ncbi:MAG: hypothetical protein AAF927_17345 [Bacteroidota bacterium]
MKSLLFWLVLLPSSLMAQAQDFLELLLIAEIASDSTYGSLGLSDRSYQDLEDCNYEDGRDMVQYSLKLTDDAFRQVSLAFESARSAYKITKKKRCLKAKEKCDIALEHFRMARQEVDEAKQLIVQIERQWIIINEGRYTDSFNELRFGWVDGPKSYYINTARLAILSTYDHLKIAKLAIEEAQLIMCE